MKKERKKTADQQIHVTKKYTTDDGFPPCYLSLFLVYYESIKVEAISVWVSSASSRWSRTIFLSVWQSCLWLPPAPLVAVHGGLSASKIRWCSCWWGKLFAKLPVPAPNSNQYEIILLNLRIHLFQWTPSQTIDCGNFVKYILINLIKVLQFNCFHLTSCNFFGCDCVTHDGDWCFYWDSNEICQPLMHEHCNAFTTMQYFNSWDMNKVIVDTAVWDI